MVQSDYVGISFFFLLLLVGTAAVSIHYRRAYEDMKKFLKNRSLYQKYLMSRMPKKKCNWWIFNE